MSLEEKIEQEKPGFFKKWGKRLLKFSLFALYSLCVIGYGINSAKDLEKYEFKSDTNIAAPVYYDIDDNEEMTQANKLLVDFPNDIPGAEFVDKYLTPGAKHCLVHIRQRHLDPDTHLNDTEEELQSIEEVQTNIYDTLSYLIDNSELKEVYTEGIPKTEGLFWENFHENYLSIQKTVQDKGEELREIELEYDLSVNLIFGCYIIEQTSSRLFSPLYVLYRSEAVQLLRILRQIEKKETYKIKEIFEKADKFIRVIEYNACLKLASEGKIKLIGTEDEYAKAMREYYENELVRDDKHYVSYFMPIEVCDDRENVILAKIAQREDTLAVLVLGAFHAFGGEHSFGEPYNYDGRPKYLDNIAVWNMMHPNNKFSLIEIFPENLGFKERMSEIKYEFKN